MKLPPVLGVAALLLLSAHGVPLEPFDAESADVDSLPSPSHHHVMNSTTSSHSGHHAAPLLELDEAEILEHHAPDPLSYWAYDHTTSSENEGGNQHGGLMLAHGVFMSVAFFGILPIGIVLRSASHPFHPIIQVAFVGCTTVGWVFSSVYSKLTPALYEGQTHSSMGYIILFVILIISAFDAFGVARTILAFIFPSFAWTRVLSNAPRFSPVSSSAYERVGLVHDEPLEFHPTDEVNIQQVVDAQSTHGPRHAHFVEIDLHENHNDELDEEKKPEPRPNRVHQIILPGTNRPRGHARRHNSEHSVSSTLRDEDDQYIHHEAQGGDEDDEDGALYSPTTLTGSPSSWNFGDDRSSSLSAVDGEDKASKMAKAGAIALYLTEWVLVYAGATMFMSGGVVYTGTCRGAYVNGCLAHIIKGGIFLIYGVISFCRYLGAWATIGWAWNRLPLSDSRKRAPLTAEFVESALIFIYGTTQSYVERMGAKPGAPLSGKEIQHVMIAVMFACAGAVGMALEARGVRRVLAVAATGSLNVEGGEDAPKGISFNPFPAIVIGVTGSAMAAHHQKYLFAVQVHALWGNLLLAYAALRCLTYAFLWVHPPRSVLPSRPPTEALASFFLTSGGLAFIASTEQVVYAAMRNGRDDIMMILTVVVALTFTIFAWCVLVRAVEGWALEQKQTMKARSTI